jgi:hypothetical protein
LVAHPHQQTLEENRMTCLASRSAILGRAARALAFCTLFLFSAIVADASEPALDRPSWSVEVKGGQFYPAIDYWKDYYGDDHTWQVAGSVAYKVLRWAEIGIEGGMIEDRGAGFAPVNNVLTGRVTYQLYPAHAYLLLRGVFTEEQWIVPYVGGGYTRLFYREKIEGQETVKGAVNGYHGRAGLQFLLDDLDRKSANNLFLSFGIVHTYLTFEVQLTKALIDTPSLGSIDLGGASYLAGLLFEF